ncbi:MAG: ectonucleotide pyrophosphatase/phosphodiesterase [Prevotella sp.]|nr:ectonucleotide pyrophosphatase/phosphodiesterase [Prevotella sp.]
MKKLLLLLALSGIFIASSAEGRHTTVIISLDGCRWDYPQWYDTPTFDFMAANGMESGLIPAFPSKTFPNHYTLATGLYPDHHGIVANMFLDTETGDVFSLSNKEQKHNPKYYGGEPIWITAKRQGLRTAVFYWPGSDVEIAGQYPDTYFNYDEKRLGMTQRIDGILTQLARPEEERPQLIMAYLEQPDANGHRYGPQSKLTRESVLLTDSLIGRLYAGLCRNMLKDKVNLLVVSDHGMAWVDSCHAVKLRPHLKAEWVRDIQGNIPACIYANEGCTDSIYEALKDLDHVRVWRKTEVPEYLHYGSSPRIGDVVVLPDIGYLAEDEPFESGGTHGFDPDLQEMHALFRAIGPDIPRLTLPHFPNVCVYSLLCRLLGIEPAPNDGYDPLEAIENGTKKN